jgi:hypothetical protein
VAATARRDSRATAMGPAPSAAGPANRAARATSARRGRAPTVAAADAQRESRFVR